MTTETRIATIVIKLPAKHARDWFNRCAFEDDVEQTVRLASTERTITLSLTEAGLKDLISDATYYAVEMGPDNTGGTDYRPAALRLLAALERLGVEWTIERSRVVLLGETAASFITDAELLRTFAHLTHLVHLAREWDRRTETPPHLRSAREKRDLVEAEILRRMAAGR